MHNPVQRLLISKSICTYALWLFIKRGGLLSSISCYSTRHRSSLCPARLEQVMAVARGEYSRTDVVNAPKGGRAQKRSRVVWSMSVSVTCPASTLAIYSDLTTASSNGRTHILSGTNAMIVSLVLIFRSEFCSYLVQWWWCMRCGSKPAAGQATLAATIEFPLPMTDRPMRSLARCCALCFSVYCRHLVY